MEPKILKPFAPVTSGELLNFLLSVWFASQAKATASTCCSGRFKSLVVLMLKFVLFFNISMRKVFFAPPPHTYISFAFEQCFLIAFAIEIAVNSSSVLCISSGE